MNASLVFVLATLSLLENIVAVVNDVLPTRFTFFQEKDSGKMVEIIEDNTYTDSKKLINCYIYGDKFITNQMAKLIPTDLLNEVTNEKIKKLIDQCITNQMAKLIPTNLLNEVTNEKIKKLIDQCNSFLPCKLNNRSFYRVKSQIYRRLKIFRRFTIYPGTKWCGSGNIAGHYDDLGYARETDKCCRTHDHCNDSIPAFTTKHSLTNKDIYTKSNCNCDDEFQSCLLKTQSRVSNLIGSLYFNFLQVQCFKYEYPQVKCLKWRTIAGVNKSCQQYELDYNREKKYQFFDAKKYKPIKNIRLV